MDRCAAWDARRCGSRGAGDAALFHLHSASNAASYGGRADARRARRRAGAQPRGWSRATTTNSGTESGERLRRDEKAGRALQRRSCSGRRTRSAATRSRAARRRRDRRRTACRRADRRAAARHDRADRCRSDWSRESVVTGGSGSSRSREFMVLIKETIVFTRTSLLTVFIAAAVPVLAQPPGAGPPVPPRGPGPPRPGQPSPAPATPGRRGAPPPAPATPRREGQPVNIKVEFTLSDQRGGAAPVKRTVSVIVADSRGGFIR